jgi:hypothetical protein
VRRTEQTDFIFYKMFSLVFAFAACAIPHVISKRLYEKRANLQVGWSRVL